MMVEYRVSAVCNCQKSLHKNQITQQLLPRTLSYGVGGDQQVQSIYVHQIEFREEQHSHLRGVPVSFHNLGPPSFECHSCNAIMWYEERNDKASRAVNPTFSICCQEGKLRLPRFNGTPPPLDRGWNWSEYVMRSLIENKTAYAEENASHFVGPLLFLMLFYVDRVRYKVVSVTVYLKSQFKLKAPATHDNEVDYISIPKTSEVAAPTVEAEAGVNIEVLSTTKKIELAVHMMKLIETAPRGVVNTPSFHRTIDKSMKSISCSTVLSTQTGSHASESTQEFDDFCNHPHVVKLLNDVDEQLKKMDEQLVRLEEMPSFSLGLIQMWNSSPNEDFGIGGSSAGKNMQDGKDDGARNVIVDVRTNTPTPAVAAENVVANENVDLQNAGDMTTGFTNAGAENTAEEMIRRCNTPARTKANYRASWLPQYATEMPQPQTDALVAKDLTQEERKDSFFENITSELNINKHLELREIDIFVFSVYRENKYFAVYVCLRNSKIVVLDSVNDDTTECHAPKYGDLLPNLLY
ncbi:hypothetical protein OROHE_026143 [Orobanche hederae]